MARLSESEAGPTRSGPPFKAGLPYPSPLGGSVPPPPLPSAAGRATMASSSFQAWMPWQLEVHRKAGRRPLPQPSRLHRLGIGIHWQRSWSAPSSKWLAHWQLPLRIVCPIGAARPARSLILPNRHGLATPAESHYSPVTLTWSRSGCGDFLALKCHGLSAAFVGRLAVRQGFVTSDNGFEKPRAALEREETQAL